MAKNQSEVSRMNRETSDFYFLNTKNTVLLLQMLKYIMIVLLKAIKETDWILLSNFPRVRTSRSYWLNLIGYYRVNIRWSLTTFFSFQKDSNVMKSSGWINGIKIFSVFLWYFRLNFSDYSKTATFNALELPHIFQAYSFFHNFRLYGYGFLHPHNQLKNTN